MSSESKLTFNDTGKEVSIFRKYLLDFLHSNDIHSNTGLLYLYKVKYNKDRPNFTYDTIMLDNLSITASNRLDATIKLFDHLNNNHKDLNPKDIYDNAFTKFQNFSLDIIISEHEKDIHSLFNSKQIYPLIKHFLNDVFNDTSILYLEELSISRQTFNQTGKDVDPLRKYLVDFLNLRKKSYPGYPGYPDHPDHYTYKFVPTEQPYYYNIDCDSLRITAPSRLEALINLADYFNEHLTSTQPFDSYSYYRNKIKHIQHTFCMDDIDYQSFFKDPDIFQIIDLFEKITYNNSTDDDCLNCGTSKPYLVKVHTL